MDESRKDATRRKWLETLREYRRDFEAPGSQEYWSPSLDCASRDELRSIQDAKLAVLTPFLYENSDFYRRRFYRRHPCRWWSRDAASFTPAAILST